MRGATVARRVRHEEGRMLKRRGNPLWRFPGVAPTAAFVFAYLYLPIFILIAFSFNENRLATIWTGFTFDWYSVALNNSDMIRAARNSLIVASSATFIATLAAIMAALCMTRERFRRQQAVNAVIALPLIVPEIVTAVATLLFFVIIGIRLGLLSVIIAHTVFCIPFAYLPIRARLQGMDPRLGKRPRTSMQILGGPSEGLPCRSYNRASSPERCSPLSSRWIPSSSPTSWQVRARPPCPFISSG